MDHRPRPPRDRGNACVMTDRKLPMQVVDQSVENVAFAFVDAQPASHTLYLGRVATGFSDSDRPAVFVDPVVDFKTALDQQLQEVLGLTVIGRHRRGGLARMRVDRSPVLPPGAPIRPGGETRIVRTTLVGQGGDGHFVSPSRGLVFDGTTLTRRSARHHMRRR
jgi:hypothetical protein